MRIVKSAVKSDLKHCFAGLLQKSHSLLKALLVDIIRQRASAFSYFDVPNVGESVLVAKAGDLLDEGHIRKVNEMNPDYVLCEAGAVLNWFDITEVEGRFSLNNTLGDIKQTLRGKLWFLGLFIALAKKQMGPQKKGEKNKKKKTKSKKGAAAWQMR